MDAASLPVLLRRVNQGNDSNIGSAQKMSSNSLSGFLSTLIPTGLTALVFLIVFLFLRRFEKRQYAPRTYIRTLPEYRRSPALPTGWFSWIKPFWKLPDVYILQHNSLDAYFFVRYLKIATTIAFVGACFLWPLLFPINITGGRGEEQFDMLSMSNVIQERKDRYYAHVFASWIFFGFVLYMIARETIYYINLRQAYLLSPIYAQRLSQRTVMYASVPEEYLSEAKLRALFGDDVERIWLNSDTKEVDELVKERDKVAYRLEAAETKLILMANKNHDKEQKKAAKKGQASEEISTGQPGDDASGSIASRWVQDKKRPTHKTKFLIGKKVDTINWSRTELERLIPEVDGKQAAAHEHEGSRLPAVFIAFKTQEAAQAAAQSVTHHIALHMAPRWIGVTPDEVVWSNLRIKWWERKIRETLTLAFVVALIIFWSIPVAFVGAVSNINYLTSELPWLGWINDIPSQILGIVTSLLPVVMLAVLMALVPIIMRIVSKLGGAPSLSAVELQTQNYYFAFQAIQGFLVATLTSAASAVAAQVVQNPSSAIPLLSENLPKASNFYISYLILQGLTVSSGAILQIVGLILSKVLGKLLGSTPRKVYNQWANLGSLGWGSLYPAFEILIMVAITYAIIAPLILGFATVGLGFIYIAFRYNFLFTSDSKIDTQGLSYAYALQHMFIGLYLAEVCLVGLFAVNKAFGPLVLEIVMLVVTVLFQIFLNSSFKPLEAFLPKTLIVEERTLTLAESAPQNGAREVESHDEKAHIDGPLPAQGVTKKPNFFAKWLRPDKYCNYATLRRLTPKDVPSFHYSDEELRTAYMNPSVGSKTPLLWLPKDKLGVSDQEVRHTSRVIPVTNEEAFLDDKNAIKWNEEVDPPIYEERKEW